MKSKKAIPYGALVIGGLVALTGIVCIVVYAWEAVIARLGEADQSLQFWYLPILFIGLIGIFTGAGLGVWGVIRLKKLQQNEATPDN